MKIMALDYGARYVGVAITDDDGMITLRHSVIDQKVHDVFHQTQVIVQDERIDKVLVGVPLSLSGRETDQTHLSLAFMEELRHKFGSQIEIEGVDETLTSVEAQRNLRGEGGNKEAVHSEAARLMLEDYLRAN